MEMDEDEDEDDAELDDEYVSSGYTSFHHRDLLKQIFG